MSGIYLDHAATTQLAHEVSQYMSELYAMNLSNPSATHGAGQKARDLVESSRAQIAGRIHASPEEIIFTSGGTEGNNWIIQRAVDDARLKQPDIKPRLITSAIEHSSVNRLAEWMAKRGLVQWQKVRVDQFGVVDIEHLKTLLGEAPRPALVSIGHANNEIGVIQDIEAIGGLCRAHGVLFHSDACQTFCHLDIDTRALPVDFLTLNSHKIRGPKGIGAMYVRKGTAISPLLIGGLQESGHRSGTIPVELIAGFAMATRLWSAAIEDHISALRKQLFREISDSGLNVKVNGPGDDAGSRTLGHVFSFTLAHHNSRDLVSRLSQHGIHCSAGAACNSGSFDASAVLLALGRNPEDAHHVRISFGASTRTEDLQSLLNTLKTLTA